MALTVTPNSGQTLNSSRTQISGNFASIDDAFKIDHVEYNLTGQGLHKRVFFVQQSSDVLTPAATDAALYTKAGTGGPTSLFFRPASNATPVEMSYALKATQGYTILPSGIWLAWGAVAGSIAGTPVAFSQLPGSKFPNICLNVTVGGSGFLGNLAAWTVTPAGFNLHASVNGIGAYYTAIGY